MRTKGKRKKLKVTDPWQDFVGFEVLLGCRSVVWTRSRLTFGGGFRVCPRRHPNLSLLPAQMRRSGSGTRVIRPMRTPRYPRRNSGRTHRGSCRSSLTLPSKPCTSLPFQDSHNRTMYLGAFHSPVDHPEPHGTRNSTHKTK